MVVSLCAQAKQPRNQNLRGSLHKHYSKEGESGFKRSGKHGEYGKSGFNGQAGGDGENGGSGW